ncbi:hypothetical protein KP509_05G037100 [Ceratopteris richardii]|uniref:ABC transporter domain-containing protein n=4 Tax=Ceratopteris richardii TaxID=49495 RepID=A0A8T2UPX1_CERRI|nr:hypothetical protein KP509_05G037100 [Ceratopteris richardii]
MSASVSSRILLSWKDLSVSVPSTQGGPPRSLLQNVSGYAEPGSLLAIMGPSGCGKSTLLNALSGRLGSATIDSGEILVNGRRQRLSYGNAAYVMQDDALIGTLTTYETLAYSAHLQLPDTMTTVEKEQRVQDAIREMGLQECADTPVGSWYIKGLSGGQKRRLTIAIETLKKRALLFLDEPTSGLDSAAALHVTKRLLTLAESGRTLLVSIHQPSSEIFQLFHYLCLLSSGQTVYFGERYKAQEFFDLGGFPCPAYRNPADHFLWVINSDFDTEAEDEEQGSKGISNKSKSLIKAYIGSDIRKEMIAKIRHATEKEGDIITKDDGDKVSAMKQTFYLTARSFTNMRRDIAYYWFRLFIYTMLSICVGTIYYKVGHSYDAIQARAGMFIFVTAFLTFMGVASFPSFIEDMKIFTRERLNGHYGATVFVVANFLSAFPFVLLLAIIPGTILYEMGGLHPGFGHYICFIITLIATLSVEESLLAAISAVAPDFLTGMIAGCGVMGIYLLNGGFFRLIRDLPSPVWRYPLSYMSFHTWTSRAFYNNDFLGLVFDNNVPGGPPLTGEEILKSRFDMYIDYSKWWPVFVLVCMAFTYRVMFLLLIKLREMLPSLIMSMRATRKMVDRASSGRFVVPHDIEENEVEMQK